MSLAGAEDRFDAEHLVAGDAVLHRPHAAGVRGDVAAEARRVLPGEHRVDQAVRGGRFVELGERHAGLDDGDVVLEIDLLDLGHVLERDEDPAGPGDARTRQAGAAAPGGDRHALLAGEPDDGRDLLGRCRPDDDVGQMSHGGERFVVAVVVADRFAGQHPIRTQFLDQALGDVSHAPNDCPLPLPSSL